MTYRRMSAQEAWEMLPPAERAGLEALTALAGDRERAGKLAKAVALERCRRARRAELDGDRDRRARVLVGARVPRSEYMAIREAAYGSGQSMYAFVRAALRRAAQGREPSRGPRGQTASELTERWCF